MCNECLSFDKEVAIKMHAEVNRCPGKLDPGLEGADIPRYVNQSTVTQPFTEVNTGD